MGEHLTKVQPGDPLRIPAATFDSMVDAAAAIVKKPIAPYVEKVYEEGSFAGQAIGT